MRRRRRLTGIQEVSGDSDRPTSTPRAKPTVVVRPTGLSKLNVEAYKLFLEACQERKIDPDQAAAVLGMAKDKPLITIRVVKQGTPGAVPVRNYSRYRMARVHLGPVFDECPHLIPRGQITCSAYLGENEAGYPLLAVAIKGGVAARGRHKKRSSPSRGRARTLS